MKVVGEPKTEQELDRRIAEAQARRVVRQARAERYRYYADLTIVGLVVGIAAARLLAAPLMPQEVSNGITDVTNTLWLLLPLYTVGVVIDRISLYRAKRREALHAVLR